MDAYVVTVERVSALRWRWSVSALTDRHGNFAGDAVTRVGAERAARRFVRERFLPDAIAARARQPLAA